MCDLLYKSIYAHPYFENIIVLDQPGLLHRGRPIPVVVGNKKGTVLGVAEAEIIGSSPA